MGLDSFYAVTGKYEPKNLIQVTAGAGTIRHKELFPYKTKPVWMDVNDDLFVYENRVQRGGDTEENESIFIEALEYINEQYLECHGEDQKDSFAKDMGTDMLIRLPHGLIGKLIGVLYGGYVERQELYGSFNSRVWGI